MTHLNLVMFEDGLKMKFVEWKLVEKWAKLLNFD